MDREPVEIIEQAKPVEELEPKRPSGHSAQEFHDFFVEIKKIERLLLWGHVDGPQKSEPTAESKPSIVLPENYTIADIERAVVESNGALAREHEALLMLIHPIIEKVNAASESEKPITLEEGKKLADEITEAAKKYTDFNRRRELLWGEVLARSDEARRMKYKEAGLDHPEVEQENYQTNSSRMNDIAHEIEGYKNQKFSGIKYGRKIKNLEREFEDLRKANKKITEAGEYYVKDNMVPKLSEFQFEDLARTMNEVAGKIVVQEAREVLPEKMNTKGRENFAETEGLTRRFIEEKFATELSELTDQQKGSLVSSILEYITMKANPSSWLSSEVEESGRLMIAELDKYTYDDLLELAKFVHNPKNYESYKKLAKYSEIIGDSDRMLAYGESRSRYIVICNDLYQTLSRLIEKVDVLRTNLLGTPDKISSVVEDLDLELWDLAIEKKKQEEPRKADEIEKALGERIINHILKSDPDKNSRIIAGKNLFHFKGHGFEPYAILNGASEEGNSGDYPLRTENVLGYSAIGQYLDELGTEKIEELKQSGLPGLREIIENLEESRGSRQIKGIRRRPDNQTGKLHENISKLAMYLWKEYGMDEERYFAPRFRYVENLPQDFVEYVKENLDKIGEPTRKMLEARIASGRLADQATIELMKDIVLKNNLSSIGSIINGLGVLRRSGASAEYQQNLREASKEILTKILDGGCTVDTSILMLSAASGFENDIIRDYLKTEDYKVLLDVWLQNKKGEAYGTLIQRMMKFDDMDSLEILLKRSESDRIAGDSFGNNIFEGLQSGENEEQIERIVDILTQKAKGEDMEAARQAANILAHISARIQPSRLKSTMPPLDEDTTERISKFHKQLVKSVATDLFESKDKTLRIYGFEMKKHSNMEIENEIERLVEAHIEVNGFFNRLPIKIKGDYQFTLEYADLVKEKAGSFSDEQTLRIINNIHDGYLLMGHREGMVRTLLESHPGISGAQEIKNMLAVTPNLSRDINDVDLSQLNEDNWATAVCAWAKISEENYEYVDVYKQLSELFEGTENKNFCLDKMRKLYVESLEKMRQGETTLVASSITRIIEEYGLENLKYIEDIGLLIGQMQKVYADERSEEKHTSIDVIDSLLEMEERMNKEKWSQDDKSQFYNISRMILSGSPSLYKNFSRIFGQLNAEGLKDFAHDMMPLYEAQMVIMQKENRVEEIVYNPRELLAMRHELEKTAEALKDEKIPRKDIFAVDKTSILHFIGLKFRERFGLVKEIGELNEENIRTIQNITRYIGNINERDEDKERILALFLGLNLDGKWQEFRRSVDVEVGEYFEGENRKFIEGYVLNRKNYDWMTAKNLGIEADRLPEFQAILQDETISQRVGNVETIDIKLGNIYRSLQDLRDPDAYAQVEDRRAIDLCLRNDKIVGKTLALVYQEASGKQVEYSPEQEAIKMALQEIYNLQKPTPEDIKSVQDRIKPIGLIARILNNIESQNIQGQIDDLHSRLVPSPQVVEIFQKLGEDFTGDSGAMALAQDLSYLENIIVKADEELQSEEKDLLQDYLSSIREKMGELEQTMDFIKTQFVQIRQSVTNQDPVFLSRLNEIENAINRRDHQNMIVTRATHNFNLIIENMRQCLGCLTAECNNDTNLTFGDRNKFYMMSQSAERMKGSIADEIVLFYPTTDEDGKKSFSFVMDQVYGSKSADVLISHINCLAKKVRQIKGAFPELPVSVMITAAAIKSVGLTTEVLESRLRQDEEFVDMKFDDEEEVGVEILPSAGGDHYLEIGNDRARNTGLRTIGGLAISL